MSDFDNQFRSVPNLRGLKGFVTVNPRQKGLRSIYTMTLNKYSLRPSESCFRHFHSNQYLRLAIARNGKAIALIASSKNDDKAMYFKHMHSQSHARHEAFNCKSIMSYIGSCLPKDVIDLARASYRVSASHADVHNDYIIFKIDDKHVIDTTARKHNQPKQQSIFKD